MLLAFAKSWGHSAQIQMTPGYAVRSTWPYGTQPTKEDTPHMESALSLLLFSFHEGVLSSLASLLERMPAVEVLLATSNPLELLARVQADLPDVVLIDDYRVPNLTALCEQVRRASTSVQLAILMSPASATLPAHLDYLALQKPMRATELGRQLSDMAWKTESNLGRLAQH